MPAGRPKGIISPCPICGKRKTQYPSGGWRCRPCHNDYKKRKARELARLPCEPKPAPNREQVQCQCGEWFERSTQRKAVSVHCHRCRSAQAAGDPTPEEITEQTAAIRAGWDEHQRRHRLGEQREYYTIPQLDSAWLLPGVMDDRDVFNF